MLDDVNNLAIKQLVPECSTSLLFILPAEGPPVYVLLMSQDIYLLTSPDQTVKILNAIHHG